MAAATLPTAAFRLWASLCPLLDGLALGALAEALEARGVLADINAAAAPQNMDALAGRWGARPGYLHLFWRVLAQLGLVDLTGPGDAGYRIYPTDRGREWLDRAAAYQGFSQRLAEAGMTMDWVMGRAAPPAGPPALPAAALGDSPVARMIAQHLRGPLVGALLSAGFRRAAGGDANRALTPEQVWAAVGPAQAYAAALLTEQGWGEEAGSAFRITSDGAQALLAAPQFFHTLSYLPTLLRSGRLLFGEDAQPPGLDAAGRETHLDRGLDIAFSGLVFRRTCAPRLLAMIGPLFNDPARAPRSIIDVGCGDGALLLTLGRSLQNPAEVLLVGVDPAAEAREQTRATLTAAGLPHLVFAGDIAAPQDIAERLAAAGHDLRDSLFISKSVFHDRDYQPPASATPTPVGPPSRCLFLAEDGGRLPTVDVERQLLEVLGRWRPWVGRHGLVIIEAHTADPTDAAAVAGRHILTPLEITHGLSHQYLLEAERFRSLVEQAGYRAVAQHDLNAWMVGKPLMTLDYYVVPS